MIRSRRFTPTGRLGLSQIELIVALLLLAAGIAIAIPAFQHARDVARTKACIRNQHDVLLCLHNFHDTNGHYPAGVTGSAEIPVHKRWSWYPAIWSYTGSGDLVFDPMLAWDVPDSHPLLREVETTEGQWEQVAVDAEIKLFLCPSGDRKLDSIDFYCTHYIGAGGVGVNGPQAPRDGAIAGAFAYESPTSMSDIADGSSNTLLLFETNTAIGSWLAGGNSTVRPAIPRGDLLHGQSRQIGGLHSGKINIGMADGSTRSLSESIDQQVLLQMFTIAGDDE